MLLTMLSTTLYHLKTKIEIVIKFFRIITGTMFFLNVKFIDKAFSHIVNIKFL